MKANNYLRAKCRTFANFEAQTSPALLPSHFSLSLWNIYICSKHLNLIPTLSKCSLSFSQFLPLLTNVTDPLNFLLQISCGILEGGQNEVNTVARAIQLTVTKVNTKTNKLLLYIHTGPSIQLFMHLDTLLHCGTLYRTYFQRR